MKSTKIKPKNESSKRLKSNKKNSSYEEPNTKFKNEKFQKLCQRNNASKERLNTIDYHDNNNSKKMHHSPRSSSNYRDYLLKDSQKKSFKKVFGKSKSKKNMPTVNPNQDKDKNEMSFGAKSKKVLRAPYNYKKFRDYPNSLIGGVLNQVNYYNTNNNSNFNDNVRYKPIDDIFNDQSPISAKKAIDINNNISPNMSFNSEIKQDIKSEQNYRPSRNKDNDEITNNAYKGKTDYNNNNDNIYNSYNVENEMKLNPDSIKTRNNDTLENNGRSISPIMSALNSNDTKNKKDNTDKNYITDIIGDINNNKKIDNINDNKNDDKDKNNYNNSIMKKKDILKHLTPKNFIVEENKSKEPLNIEKVNNFIVDNDYNYNNNDFKNNNFMDNLEISSVNTFTYPDELNKNKDKKYYKDNDNKKRSNNFENLKFIQRDSINLMNEAIRPEKNYRIDTEDGKLQFNNDEEVLDYIKRKIKAEKDLEYNDKLKYNYFILTKKFHGKILYEIGLENDLNSINKILQKENVEIEHDQVIFVKKKELEQLRNGIAPSNHSEAKKLNKENQKLNKENEKLNQENDKLFQENEQLSQKIDLMSQNIGDNNTKLIIEYNKLLDQFEILKENNKKLENELNDKKNIIKRYEERIKEYNNKLNDSLKIIDDYSNRFKQYENDDKFQNYNKLVEENNKLQTEREKLTKYIYELQVYDEKVIIEYQKVKVELEKEKQKNKMNNNTTPSTNAAPITKKYFSNNELSINTNSIFCYENKNKKLKPNQYEMGYLSEQFLVDSGRSRGTPSGDTRRERENNFNYNNKYHKNNDRYRNNNDYYEDNRRRDERRPVSYYNEDRARDRRNERRYDDNDYNRKKHNRVGFEDRRDDDDFDLEDEHKRAESTKRAMKRINNRRKLDKMNEDKNKFRKSNKIAGMAEELEGVLNNDRNKLYGKRDNYY